VAGVTHAHHLLPSTAFGVTGATNSTMTDWPPGASSLARPAASRSCAGAGAGEVVIRQGTNFGGGRRRERDWRPWGAHRRPTQSRVERAVSGRDFAVFAGAGVWPEQGRGIHPGGLSKVGAAWRPAPVWSPPTGGGWSARTRERRQRAA
jgi:hypothetical protein